MKSKTFLAKTAGVITALLFLPFVISFHFSQGFNGPGQDAGRIFGKKIALDQYQRQRLWLARQLAQQFGDNLPPDILEQQVWDRMLLIEEARRQGVAIEDDELSKTIHEDTTFHVNGRFQRDRYYTLLKAIGSSPQLYETFLREQLLINKLLDNIRSKSIVTDADVTQAHLEENEKRRVKLASVRLEEFRPAVEAGLDEEDLQAFYDEQGHLFRTQEEVTFDYIASKQSELRKSLEIPEEDLKKFYDENPKDFSIEKESKHTQGDKKSKQSDSNQNETSLEEAPLTETFRPFEEVKDEIREKLLPQNLKEAMVDLALDLEEALATNQAFKDIAEENGLEIKTVGPIQAGSLWVPNAPEPLVLQQAFDLDVGQLSEVIETEEGVYVVLLTKREPPMIPPLVEIRKEVKTRMTEQRINALGQDTLEKLRDQLIEIQAAEISFEQACLQLGLAFSLPEPFTRNASIEGIGYAPALNRGVFERNIGELTEVIQTPTHVMLAQVEEIITPEELAMSNEQRSELRQHLLNQKQQEFIGEWLEQLREEAEIERFTLTTTDEGT